MSSRHTRHLLALVIVTVVAAAPGGAATIVVVNNDGPGEGFNSTATPTADMGCPAGMNLGQCRLNAFTAAANQWAATLASDVEIRVGAQFNPLTCDASGAVLGSCGANTIHRDFPGAPFAGTWYHAALANALAGYDVNGADVDMNAQFNSALDDDPACTLNWWYGTDGAFPGNFDPPDANATHFYAVLLHEMAHGLGFQNFINEQTGLMQGGYPDVYARFTLDTTTGLHWHEMTNNQRVASAINTGNVVLDSPKNKIAADAFLSANSVSLVVPSGAAAGTYVGSGALFGGSATRLQSLSGTLELVNDGSGASTSDACEPLVGFTPGRIAFIDRGTCQFGLKVLNAEKAGARGVVVANNQGGTVLINMAPGVVGRQASIPAMSISQNDGTIVRAALPTGGGFSVTSVYGVHANGFPLVYAPNPVELGSSISHYDTLVYPNALMEPFINPDLYNDQDMTVGLYLDEGWVVVPIFSDGFELGAAGAWAGLVP